MKLKIPRIQATITQKIMLMLCISLILVPVISASAATQRVYQYNENGRLSVMYTATQKTTYAYDKNGNLVSKQVEQGDYNSVVNPVPVTTQPTPQPTPTPVPTPTPTPEPAPDPSIVPPPVPVPAKAGLPIRSYVDKLWQGPVASKNGTIVVQGWYLDPVGVQKIEIYVDGVYHGRINMGGSREDVYQAYPDYNNHVAGFYASAVDVQTPGTPYAHKNKKGKREILPGQFEHDIRVTVTNRANVVTAEFSNHIVINLN